ncbi:MAG: DUF2334 domain-containing protein [Burkholderiaceae bacterium]
MNKFIIRFDDITPTMAWSKFSNIEKTLIDFDIKPIMGVVPLNKDAQLIAEPQREDFWSVVKGWRAKGWTIAQHGYTHEYVTTDPGILKINRGSEFSGLPYEEQYRKLKAGKEILGANDVWQPVFMAPAHSFDRFTISALTDLGFKSLTDGYGVYPYMIENIRALPQLFSAPIHFGFGVYTFCMHVNAMTMEQINHIDSFLRKNHRRFISFDEALAMKSCAVVSRTARYFSKVGLCTARGLRKKL